MKKLHIEVAGENPYEAGTWVNTVGQATNWRTAIKADYKDGSFNDVVWLARLNKEDNSIKLIRASYLYKDNDKFRYIELCKAGELIEALRLRLLKYPLISIGADRFIVGYSALNLPTILTTEFDVYDDIFKTVFYRRQDRVHCFIELTNYLEKLVGFEEGYFYSNTNRDVIEYELKVRRA